MGKKYLTFGNIEIEKNNFYRHKMLFFWEMYILKKY